MSANSKMLVISMLFSDVKGFSAIKSSALKERLTVMLESCFEKPSLNPQNHIFCKTWGDAYFICGEDPIELANIALKLRDYFTQQSWKANGFSTDLQVRIGLNTERVKVLYNSDGSVKDVLGAGVDETARIEPIAEPNHVYCSRKFYDYLEKDSLYNIVGTPKGRVKLAKDYGELELYELMWAIENQSGGKSIKETTTEKFPPIPMPKVHTPFGDKQRKEFVNHAYDVIKEYFQNAVTQLNTSSNFLEASFDDIDNTRFVIEIYENNNAKIGCSIWLGSTFSNGIYYSQGGRNSDLTSSNSWNESLLPVEFQSELFLQMSLGDMMGGDRDKKHTPIEAGEALWKRLIKWM